MYYLYLQNDMRLDKKQTRQADSTDKSVGSPFRADEDRCGQKASVSVNIKNRHRKIIPAQGRFHYDVRACEKCRAFCKFFIIKRV